MLGISIIDVVLTSIACDLYKRMLLCIATLASYPAENPFAEAQASNAQPLCCCPMSETPSSTRATFPPCQLRSSPAST